MAAQLVASRVVLSSTELVSYETNPLVGKPFMLINTAGMYLDRCIKL
jgi:hypothetical protein